MFHENIDGKIVAKKNIIMHIYFAKMTNGYHPNKIKITITRVQQSSYVFEICNSRNHAPNHNDETASLP